MNLIGLLRDVVKAASTQGAEVAGTTLCGPFWPMLRPIIIPIVSRFADLPSVPDERLAEALQAERARDDGARAIVDALSGLFETLNEQTFRTLVLAADTRAEVMALNTARRRPLYWQMYAAVDLAKAWFAARENAGDAEAIRRLRAACAQVGLSSDAIDHVLYAIANVEDVEAALLEFTSTLDCIVHPFVGAMAKTGSRLIGQPKAMHVVLAVWEERGVGAIVKPYIEGAARADGPVERLKAINDLIAAVAVQG